MFVTYSWLKRDGPLSLAYLQIFKFEVVPLNATWRPNGWIFSKKWIGAFCNWGIKLQNGIGYSLKLYIIFRHFFGPLNPALPVHCVFWQGCICKIFPISARIQQMKWIIKINISDSNLLIYISIYSLFYMKNIFSRNDAIQNAIWIQIVWRLNVM